MQFYHSLLKCYESLLLDLFPSALFEVRCYVLSMFASPALTRESKQVSTRVPTVTAWEDLLGARGWGGFWYQMLAWQWRVLWLISYVCVGSKRGELSAFPYSCGLITSAVWMENAFCFKLIGNLVTDEFGKNGLQILVAVFSLLNLIHHRGFLFLSDPQW